MSDSPKSVNTNAQKTSLYDPHVIPGYSYLAAIYPNVAKCLVHDCNRESGSEMSRSIEMCDWKCPDCQGIYTAFMQDVIFLAAKGKSACPYCNETQVLPSYNSLKVRHPDVAKLWSHRNEKTADHVLPRSTEQALWVCSECYNEYKATILSMTSGEMKCPFCTGWKALPGVSPFSTKHLDIVELWSSRNKRTASEVNPESAEGFLWNCPECHGEFKSTIQKMMTGEASCPYCNNRRVLSGFNSLAQKYPEIAKLWSSRNEKTADEVLYNSAEIALWTCPECHGEFSVAVGKMSVGRGDCPYCNDRRVLSGFNSLAAKYPDVARLWSSRNTKSADEVLYNARESALWLCPECHGEFSSPVEKMTVGDGDCPYCNSRRVLPGFNSLAAKYPDIARLWSSRNEKTADEVLYNSAEIALWTCPECHGEFSAAVEKMSVGGGECPYCNDRRVLPGYNSLKAKYPDVARLWSSQNIKTADEVLYNARESVLWSCPNCHGEFRSPVGKMAVDGGDCPYCNDRRVLPGFNSFAVKHKDLLAEWDYVNNYILADPDQILDSCQIPVWWKCPVNEKHEYAMSPEKRVLYQVRKKKSCPYCKGLRRKKRHFI